MTVPRTPDIGRKGLIPKRPILSGLAHRGCGDLSGLGSCLSTNGRVLVRIGIRPLYHALVEVGSSRYIFNVTRQDYCNLAILPCTSIGLPV